MGLGKAGAIHAAKSGGTITVVLLTIESVVDCAIESVKKY